MSSFIRERKDYLMRLEYLLGRASSTFGLRSFDRDELYELGRLYRKLAGDLAKAQTIGADKDTLAYLNGLLASAHNVVYRGESQPLTSFIKFVTSGFPRLFRKHFGVIFIAILVFFLPAIWAYLAYLADPTWGEIALPPAMQQEFEQGLEEGPNQLAAAIRNEDMSLASTYIILNNIRVCAYAFAAGIFIGAGTLFILLRNGLILGTIAAIFVSNGPDFSLYFFSGVLPHGVLELPAICISGGAGLLLGKAILVPGELRRGEAIKKYGKDAAGLLMGVALTLVVAGLIEGFITPLKIGGTANVPVLMYAKIAFSVMAFLLFSAYLTLAGKQQDEKPFEFAAREFDKIGAYSPQGIYRVLISEKQEIA